VIRVRIISILIQHNNYILAEGIGKIINIGKVVKNIGKIVLAYFVEDIFKYSDTGKQRKAPGVRPN